MAEYDIQDLLKKWQPLLDHDELPKIRDANRRNTTAVLLENQYRANKETVRRDPTNSLTYLLEAAPTNHTGNSIATYDPVLISLVRRSMPNLIAYDVCGVQPMALPTGLIFALRSRYGAQNSIEALFNEANTAFGSSNANGNTFGGTQVGADPSTMVSDNTSYTVAHGRVS